MRPIRFRSKGKRGTGPFPSRLVPFEFEAGPFYIGNGVLVDLTCRNMPTSEEYRKLAEECRRNAGEADHPDERDTLLQIGELWERLAERKATRERNSSS
jgi:hypothetical protein